jgi:hypothetical protein
MVLSLLFGKKSQKGKVGSVELDVTIREEHRYSSRVTNYPVEDGSNLSDHIINDPPIVTLEGIVTDTPLAILTFFNRSVSAFNQLVEIHEKRELVTVVTGLKVYPNMAITVLDVPRDIRTGQSLKFTIELQNVVLDTSVRLEINEENLFGGVQSKIPREIVSSGEDIPLIQSDPVNSLKDQATSGKDFGIQSLQTPPTDILAKINESLLLIQGVA